jgi:beta-xylosidase
MVASGTGYLMVGADGGVFNFGNPFFGSLGASPPRADVMAVAPSFTGGAPNGYWMLDRGGEVFGFGAAWMPPSATTAPAGPAITPAGAPASTNDAPDPDLVRDGGTWYTFTTGTTWGNNLGVLTSSSPTGGWRTLSGQPYGSTALANIPTWERPGTQTSPGVYQWGGRWVMFYDAIDNASGKYCLSVATSSSPAAPFSDASSGTLECQVNLGGSIDPSPFVDANGQPWVAWKSNDGSSLAVSDVWAAPLASNGVTLAGPPQIVMAKDSAAHPWETTVDDPQMVVAGGRYLLFFTGGDWQSAGYAMGYAVCAGPTGPCTQPQAGPLLSSYGPAAGPGGGSLASDASGNWFVAYAAWSPGCTNYGCGGKRQLYVAPITLG